MGHAKRLFLFLDGMKLFIIEKDGGGVDQIKFINLI